MRTPAPCFELRWERLVRFVREQQLVPFVGAGVSMGARIPGSDFRPTTEELARRLREGILEHLGKDTYEREAVSIVVAPLFDRKDREKLADRGDSALREALEDARSSTARLDRLAEVLRVLEGACTVVDRLELHLFADLQPTPAHGFIARLAREGLVTEVFTTNYDCCLELAYRQTFRFPRDPAGGAGCWPAVVYDAETYRQHAGRRFLREDPGSEPILHVYKLNGCADAWRRVRNANPPAVALDLAARSLALSESDLHELEHGWKRDLLRVAAATRCLLLTGFGSDEGQVRYTVLKILEEQHLGRSLLGGSPSSDPWGQPGAPFVHGYAATPSYAQLQLLVAYAVRVARQPSHGGLLARASVEQWNFVGGRDSERFRLGLGAGPTGGAGAAPSGALDADRFWACLYADVIQRELAYAVVDPRTPAGAWLAASAVVREAHDRLAIELKEWLEARGYRGGAGRCEPPPWGPLAVALVPDRSGFQKARQGGVARSRWDEALCAMRGHVACCAPAPTGASGGPAPWGRNEYRPLRQDGAQWAALAFLVRSVGPASGAPSEGGPGSSWPLRVRRHRRSGAPYALLALPPPRGSGDEASRRRAWAVLHDTAAVEPPSRVELEMPSCRRDDADVVRPVYAVHLPARRPPRRGVRRSWALVARGGGHSLLRVGRLWECCALDLAAWVRNHWRRGGLHGDDAADGAGSPWLDSDDFRWVAAETGRTSSRERLRRVFPSRCRGVVKPGDRAS